MEKDILEVQRHHLHNVLEEREDQALNDIMKQFMAVYTYDAISMEGQNRIPFEDVKRLIDTKALLDYSEREQKEVLNQLKAFDYLNHLLAHEIPLTEELTKDIHEILVDGIFPGGVYRQVNIQIMGANHQPTDYAKVYDRMHKHFKTLNENQFDSSIEKAVYAHAGIAKIHPFVDGNGRLTRLILNYYLMKSGYLPISISLKHKEHYFSLLETFKSEKNIQPLVLWIKQLMIERYESVMKQLEVS
jgi:Fic family protein